MLAITCSSCQKKLGVKDDLADKKVKCPGCGQVTTVAAKPAVIGNDDLRTLPPAPNLEGPTLPPRPVDASDTPTSPSLSKPDATQGIKPDAGHDSSLTDFLAPPQADDELGRLGDFRILKILGHGGMGVVFLGEDPKLGRKVAIKAMLPHLAESKSSQQRFLREARSAATLEHDHIVPIFHVGVDRSAPYIVMPFLKGEPLDERLKRDEAIPLSEMLRIGREIAEALNAAHSVGLVHRDIKPANVWLEAPKHRVKILDFGLARAVQEDSGLTQQGAIIGTRAYMAPEQGRGDPVDARCDLFSLGVVLYRLCTGQQPFHGKDTVSTLMAVAMTEPAAPIKVNSELPPELSALVMKLLEKDRDKRIAAAGEVVNTIQAIEKKLAAQQMADGITEALPGTTPKKRSPLPPSPPLPGRGAGGEGTPPKRRRSRTLFAVGLVGLVAVLCAVGVGIAMFQSILLYMKTGSGTVRIETNVPDIAVALDQKNPGFMGGYLSEQRVAPGEHGLLVKRGDLQFATEKFHVRNGETVTLKIEWSKEGKLQVVLGDKVIGEKAVAKKGTEGVAQQFALAFNGELGAVDFPGFSTDLSKPITLEAYLTPDPKQPPSGKARRTSVFFDDLLYLGGGDGQWHFGVWKKAEITNAGEMGRRTHVAGVLDGKVICLYVDGLLVRREQVGLDEPFRRQKHPFKLGWAYRGLIAEVRVSTVARYDKDFTPTQRFERDADTLALYHFDEGSGDVLKDSSGNGHHGKIVGAKWVKADGTPAVAGPMPTYALRFDRRAKAVKLPAMRNSPTGPLTHEMYVEAKPHDGVSTLVGLQGSAIGLGGIWGPVWFSLVPVGNRGLLQFATSVAGGGIPSNRAFQLVFASVAELRAVSGRLWRNHLCSGCWPEHFLS